MALAGLGAFLGHLWPVFFKFEGGKGVATALGVLVGFSGWLGLLVLACWVVVTAIWRYSSLSSLVAAVMAPVLYILLGGDLWEFNKWIFLAILAMSALLVYRHKLNIQRLLEGKESKLGQKKSK
ncbi:putative glycerol-3-phosphate acyltransferase [compost metagenome]